jgi:hypothetical protein
MSTTATAATITCRLVSRHDIAEGTMAFRFGKPSGWAFQVGQFLDMTLLASAEMDAEGNTRGFSIASDPLDDTLMVATRLRDTAFKRGQRAFRLAPWLRLRVRLAISLSITTSSAQLCSRPAALASPLSEALCSVRRGRNSLTASFFSTRTGGRRMHLFSKS